MALSDAERDAWYEKHDSESGESELQQEQRRELREALRAYGQRDLPEAEPGFVPLSGSACDTWKVQHAIKAKKFAALEAEGNYAEADKLVWNKTFTGFLVPGHHPPGSQGRPPVKDKPAPRVTGAEVGGS